MIIVAQVKVGSDWREVDEQCDNVGQGRGSVECMLMCITREVYFL